MKLIDLLVKELPKLGGWPEGAKYIVQDGDDGMIKTSENLPTELNPRGVWKTPPQGWGNCGGDIRDIATLADDYATAIVTRAQYEAALAKNDGWIEWGGGACPVHGTVYVDVKLRSGHVTTERRAYSLDWNHYTPDGDGAIISYRPHRDINSRTNDDRLEQDLNECIGQNVALAWNGKGLPPLGVECEWKDKNTKQWQPVKVVYTSEWVTVIREINKEKGDDLVEIAIENYGDDARLKFRPLSTESEKARESAINDIAILIGRGTFYQDAERIYDAISYGEIKVYNKGCK